MALERVAGFGVFVPYRVAPVPAEPLQPTGVRPEAHAGIHAAATQAVAAEGGGGETGGDGAALHDLSISLSEFRGDP